QAVVTEAPHLFAVIAGQHLGKMTDSEAHLGAESGGQQLARNLGRVDGCWRLEAIVAIAAALGWVLAEMPEQDRPAAGRRLHERGKRVQALALGGTAVGLDLLFDPLPSTSEVLRRPEQ